MSMNPSTVHNFTHKSKAKAPFTDQEEKVSQHLKAAFNAFMELEAQHPQERSEFTTAIHNAQAILAMRIVRRDYPEYFPTYEVEP